MKQIIIDFIHNLEKLQNEKSLIEKGLPKNK